MGNPNFVHDLVQMAKAFEELPQVQAELTTARSTINDQQATIQRLELKLLDRANEIDNLNAAVLKAEVERDHAEHMFLETDDRLNALRGLIRGFQGEVDTLDKVAEFKNEVPTPSVAPAEPFRSDYRPTPDPFDRADTVQPIEAITKSVASEDHIDMGLSTTRQNELHEIATTSHDINERIHANNELADIQGVSVSDYPTSATSSSEGSVTDAGSATVTTDATPVDDVGYHNEPPVGNSYDPASWEPWDSWRIRMDTHYGMNRWPSRPDATPATSRASTY